MRALFSASLNLLFPPLCLCCDKAVEVHGPPLCPACLADLQPIQSPYCSCCGRAFSGQGNNHLCEHCLRRGWNFHLARSLFLFEERIAHLIHQLKYQGKITVVRAIRPLARESKLLADLHSADLIMPVPLHLNRLRRRGFNQSTLLARACFPGERKKICSGILIRATDTPSQTGLNGKERRKNLRNAFGVTDKEAIRGRNIILVDDVFTTGSTINECAGVLRRAGAGRIEALTICRADRAR